MTVSILDYNVGEIVILHVDENQLDLQNEDVEEFLEKKGFKMSQVHYMCSDTLNIRLI